MKFLDFFSGIGTIRIGMEQAGHECVGHVEWDKYAQASYMAMHDVKESEFIGWDIRGVRADELPRANAWWFGAPCQDFSIAGKRKGLEGDRSSLVREIFRLVRETEEADRPEWLLYENVKGMLSSNGGFDFLGILLEMDELGYDIEWQTLNSKNFGVPQNRERVFTIGHSRRFGRREILPIGGTDVETGIPIKIVAHRDGYRQNTQTFDPSGITEALSTALSTAQGGGRGHHVAIQMNRHRIKKITNTSHSLMARDYKGFGNQDMTGVIEKRQNGRRFKEDGDPMFTLTAQDRHGVLVREATSKGYDIAEPGDSINLEQPNSKTRRGRVGKGIANTLTTSCNQATIIDDIYKSREPREYDECAPTLRSERQGLKVRDDLRIRKLTPRECFRLQGIPDEYFDKAQAVNSDSQLYKQAGNACTVNVIYEIAKRLEVNK